jgi:hypothetical protein
MYCIFGYRTFLRQVYTKRKLLYTKLKTHTLSNTNKGSVLNSEPCLRQNV